MTTTEPSGEGPVLSHALPHRRETPLRMVLLYREELVEAARIIRDECGHVEIDFHDDRGTRGTAPEAFAAFAEADGPERLRRLTISGNRGPTTLRLLIAPSEARVVVEEPDNSARGATERLHNLCHLSRGRPWAFLVGSRRDVFKLIGVSALIGTCALFAALLLEIGAFVLGALLLLPAGVFMVLNTWQMYRFYLVPAKPVLINAPRAQRPTWWERHRKDVLLVLISGVVGIVTGYFVNQIPPPPL